MPGRKAKSVKAILAEGNKSHLTKEEIEKRQDQESILTNLRTNKIKPPKWLGKTAKKIFKEIANELEVIELLSNVDVYALAITSDAMEKYIECTVVLHVEEPKLEVATNRGINIIENPTIKTQMKYATLYKQYASELGLTPAARLKIVNKYIADDDDDEFESEFG